MASPRVALLLVFGLLTTSVCSTPLSGELHAASSDDLSDNEVYSRTLARDSLLSDIMAQCVHGFNMEAMTCIRVRVLMYLDQLLGTGSSRHPHYRLSERVELVETPEVEPVPDPVPRDTTEETSSNSDGKLDSMIVSRVARLVRSHAVRVQLPETFFQSAVITVHPASLDMDVQFPTERAAASRSLAKARGILKKKLLLPVLLLLKLKMKALMPILVAISSIKALKALIISKIALLVVGGFVFLQLCKKLGGGAAMMPMMMPMEPMMTPAPATYGAPAPPMPYSAPAPAPPTNSYGPSETSWEPAPAASSNTYSRVWDAHQMAYKAYYNPDSTVSQQSQQTQQSSTPQ